MTDAAGNDSSSARIRVQELFAASFPADAAAPVSIARAPGRVNLIGEHTDYNDGFVLPMALPMSTWIVARARPDRTIRLFSEGYGETRFTIDELAPGRPVDGWGSHVAGTLWAMREAGVALVGFEGAVATDVPVGASLSSSAALEVATAAVASAVAGLTFDPVAAALAGNRAEGDFLGFPSGIMDQLVSARAVADHALLIDCRDLSTESVPLPASATVVILDTMSRRELAESQYALRRADCTTACRELGIDSLRDATAQLVEDNVGVLGERVANRARHVVAEIARTTQAALDLRNGDIEAFGSAMDASHESLRDLYQVSGPQLDTMVECARRSPGVLGARMTGGGFAGAAVALVRTAAVDDFVATVTGAVSGCDRRRASLFRRPPRRRSVGRATRSLTGIAGTAGDGGLPSPAMADLLTDHSSGPARLRELLARPEPLLLPGCYDGLGARLIERADFEAVYMTGFGTSASLLGRPDVGLLDLSEMVGNARRIVQATSLPVVADADTGYGNAINVIRTVREYEQAGVAGLHIEDQVMPKKCGHMDDKAVISRGEMVAKVSAAVAARSDPDFVVIARTDARGPEGLEAAIDRARACRDAGADLLFVEALRGLDEIERVCSELSGTPLVFNWVDGGKTPPLDHDTIAGYGFAAILMPISMLLAATNAMVEVLAEIRARRTPAGLADRLPAFTEFTDLIGLPEIVALQERFAEPI